MAQLSENMQAQVVSAAELSGEQISVLCEALSKKLGRQVDISSSVDPSLIGGLYICVDGYVLDRSVKKLLGDLRDNIKRRVAQ